MGWKTMGLERSEHQMCVACRSALFYHGMGGTVEKGVVGLLTSAVFFFLIISNIGSFSCLRRDLFMIFPFFASFFE